MDIDLEFEGCPCCGQDLTSDDDAFSKAQDYERGRLDIKQEKDGAYAERNMCVSLIANMAMKMGYPVGIGKTNIEGWNPEYNNIVYIDLPSGQVSWHYHDNETQLFDHLPKYDAKWDGHDTQVKYERVLEPRLDSGE